MTEYTHTDDLLEAARARLATLTDVYARRGEGVRSEKMAVALRHMERTIAAYERASGTVA